MAETLNPREKRVMDLFTIVTGGATGADSLAEELAREWGMKVKLYLTPHHHQQTMLVASTLYLTMCFLSLARATTQRNTWSQGFCLVREYQSDFST